MRFALAPRQPESNLPDEGRGDRSCPEGILPPVACWRRPEFGLLDNLPHWGKIEIPSKKSGSGLSTVPLPSL